jgi:predicted Fe-S protein YdhL (DUF1289 family)
MKKKETKKRAEVDRSAAIIEAMTTGPYLAMWTLADTETRRRVLARLLGRETIGCRVDQRRAKRATRATQRAERGDDGLRPGETLAAYFERVADEPW